MARTRSRSARSSMSVRVDGLEEFRKIPGMIDRGERVVLERSTDRIGEEIAKRAPGGESGSIGRGVETRTVTSTLAEIRLTHPGSRAHERGAYIVPGGQTRRGSAGLRSRAGALRFRDGSFRPSARIPASRFATKGLRPRRKIITTEYRKVFDDLRRTAL